MRDGVMGLFHEWGLAEHFKVTVNLANENKIHIFIEYFPRKYPAALILEEVSTVLILFLFIFFFFY